MVTSVFAGTIAFAGSAAAAHNSVPNDRIDTAGNFYADGDNAAKGTVSGLNFTKGIDALAGSSFQSGTVQFTGGSYDGNLNQVEDGDVNIYIFDNKQRAYEFLTGNRNISPKSVAESDASVGTADSNSLTFQQSSSTSVESDDILYVEIQDNFLNPSTAASYDAQITLEGDSNTQETVSLSVQSTTSDDTGGGGIAAQDAFWDDRSTRYQGQTLKFTPNGPSADYGLYSCDYDAVADACDDPQIVKDLPDTQGEQQEISTSGLEGSYVIAVSGGSDVVLTDSSGVETSRNDAPTSDPSTDIIVQTFDASFDDSSVAEGNSETLSLSSDVRANYRVQISSSDFTQSELGEIFSASSNADVDEPSGADNITVSVDSTDYDLSADFSGISTGNYDFNVDVIDTTADDDASIEVTDAADTTATFAQSAYVEERGDEVEITVDLSNADAARVQIGTDDVNYRTVIRVEDTDDDGDAQFIMDTSDAGVGASNEKSSGVYEGADGDTVTSADRKTQRLNEPLDAADYDLTALLGQTEEDVAVLSLTERGTQGGALYTAPSSFDNANPATAYSDASSIRSAATKSNVVADGDHVIFQVNATGISGYADAPSGDSADTIFQQTSASEITSGDQSDNLRALGLVLEEANAGVNADSADFDISQGEVYTDGENDTLFVVFDTDSYDSMETGERYTVKFTIPKDNAYIQNKSAVERVNKTFRVQERQATFDTGDNSVVTVEAASGQTISGTTNIAPGSEFDIRAKATGQSAFLLTQPATVQPNGTFSAEFDFSNVSDNTSFTLTIPSQNFEDNAATPGRVGQAETAAATFNNQTFTGQASSVEVESVTTSDGGFVTIHDSTLISDGAVFDSVRGTSAYLEPGEQTNVTIELDSPIAPSGSGTFYAMPHLDTDGDQTYDFVTSEGADDGPYATNEGNAVVDPATITVQRVATVTFNDQQQMGDTMLVESARLPSGGFVTIHDATVADDPFGSVRGTSAYLESGTSADVNITLDEPAEESGQFFAMPHRDTDGDETYDFVTSNGDDDGPYLNADGQIVLDAAQIQVGPMDTPTEEPTPTPTEEPDDPTPTETEEPDDPTPTEGEETTTTSSDGQPGFGLAVSLIALAGAALIALRRRD